MDERALQNAGASMSKPTACLVFYLLLTQGCVCWASDVPTPLEVCNAVYWAEGGANTRFPYGIMVKYKYTTPRQACINTVSHRLRDWNGESDFIEYLSLTYCPIGAKNDPKGLNKNWVKNVKYFINHPKPVKE
jgi:hypothetical protein